MLKGDFDTRTYIEGIRDDYPAIAFWLCLQNFTDDNTISIYILSPVDNLHASELLHNPHAITRDIVPWGQKRYK